MFPFVNELDNSNAQGHAIINTAVTAVHIFKGSFICQ